MFGVGDSLIISNSLSMRTQSGPASINSVSDQGFHRVRLLHHASADFCSIVHVLDL